MSNPPMPVSEPVSVPLPLSLPMNVLILGGTGDARALASLMVEANIRAIVSLAGRVERPAAQAVPVRVGGFGGVAGLEQWIRAHNISHVIDATHPFAAQISAHAIAACHATLTPLLALERPAWQKEPHDLWHHADDMAAAVRVLAAAPAQRVMLAIGRLQLEAFAAAPQHFYLLRLVDPPAHPLPLPHCQVIVERGPFDLAADTKLLRDHKIDLLVSKNAGGDGAFAKIAAARALRLPVLMIARPALAPRMQVSMPAQALAWLRAHQGNA